MQTERPSGRRYTRLAALPGGIRGMCVLALIGLPTLGAGWWLGGYVPAAWMAAVLCIVVALAGMGAALVFWAPALQAAALAADEPERPSRSDLQKLQGQLARTQSKLEELQEGLDVAIDDNLHLREAIDAGHRALDDRLAALRAVVRASSERVIVTDLEARILCMSQSAATLVGARSNEVEGRPSDEVLKFFDAYKDNPREYPLNSLVPDIIERGSAMLMMTDVVLLDARQNAQKMLLLSEAVLNPAGVVVGSLLRLQEADAEDSIETRRSPRERTAELRDPTTNLPTRGEFTSRLTELIHTAQTKSATHQLLLLTVDNLQSVYDDIGYWAGEELLWSVAQLIRAEMSGPTELFRITAVHFALLLPQCKAAPGDRLAESIRLSVESAQFSWNEKHYRSTISIGICEIDGDTPGTTAMISRADADLRVARARGGNRVQRHHADDLLLETQAIENRLMEWLDGEDQTHLQLQSCEFRSADEAAPLIGAMLRVELDDGFWIDPVAFQSSADNSGLSSKIDLWLLRRSLAAMQEAFAGQGRSAPRVLVPISGMSLENKGLLTQLRILISEAGAAGGQLVMQLDERDARNRPGLAAKFRKELTELGMGFALRACRTAALADLIPRLKPDFVGLPAHVAKATKSRLVESEIHYFRAVAEEIGFQLFVDGVDAEDVRQALHRAGVHLVGDKGSPFGPLSEFAGLQLQARQSS